MNNNSGTFASLVFSVFVMLICGFIISQYVGSLRDNHDLRQQLTDRDNQLVILQQQFDQSNQASQGLQAKLDAEAKQRKQAEESARVTGEQLAVVTTQYEGASKTLKSLEGERNQLAQKIQALIAERDGLVNQLGEANNARNTLAKQVNDLSTQNNALTGQVQAVTEKRDQLNQQALSLTDERDNLRSLVNNLVISRDAETKRANYWLDEAETLRASQSQIIPVVCGSSGNHNSQVAGGKLPLNSLWMLIAPAFVIGLTVVGVPRVRRTLFKARKSRKVQVTMTREQMHEFALWRRKQQQVGR